MAQTDVPAAGAQRRARGDRTRTAIIEAALALFDAQGVQATSIDEITAAAAVAKGTFYVHFHRKEDVLLERAAQLTHQLHAQAPPAGADAVAALRALADLTASTVSAGRRALIGRAVRELMGQRAHWERVLGARPTLGMVVEPLVAAGQRQGVLRTDQTARRLAHSLTVLWLDNVITWAERPEPRPLGRELERSLALFLDGALLR